MPDVNHVSREPAHLGAKDEGLGTSDRYVNGCDAYWLPDWNSSSDGFRASVLGMKFVADDLKKFWLGHENNDIAACTPSRCLK